MFALRAPCSPRLCALGSAKSLLIRSGLKFMYPVHTRGACLITMVGLFVALVSFAFA